jgi:hypothetical protein
MLFLQALAAVHNILHGSGTNKAPAPRQSNNSGGLENVSRQYRPASLLLPAKHIETCVSCETQTRYAALSDAFEELRHMRSTQTETELEFAEKTWKTRITAQQAVIDALRQENQSLQHSLEAAHEKAQPAYQLETEHAALQAAHTEATKALAVLHGRITELEVQLQAEGGTVPAAGAAAASTAATTAEHQIVKVFQHLTRIKIAPVQGDVASYSVTLLARKHKKVHFGLKFVKGASGAAAVQYTPQDGTGALPAFMQGAIEFDVVQAPMFIAKMLEAVFGEQQ